MNKSHLLARRSLTRKERLAQILMIFDMPRRCGRFDGVTANSVATEIGLLGVEYVRDMLNELVRDGKLFKTKGVHRMLKNGTTIDKYYYWRNRDFEVGNEAAQLQLSWLGDE